jgi:FecR protein
MRALCIAACGLLLAVAAQAGDEVGFVRLSDDVSELEHAGAWSAIREEDLPPVRIDDGLRTRSVAERKGALTVKFEDRSILDLSGDTEVHISAEPTSGSGAGIQLRQGSVHVVAETGGGTACTMRTSEAVIECKGTEFIVLRNAADASTRVIVVAGAVTVRNVKDIGETVTVRAHQSSTVRPGEPPTLPRWVDDETIDSYLQAFRFIGGGRSVSLASQSGLLAGGMVPVEAQAPAAPPATTPGQPEFEHPDPGEVQPPFALQPGQLDLNF